MSKQVQSTLGSLGDIPFGVSDKTYQTYSNMSWNSTANYATHALHGKTAMLELTGFDTDEISFDMYLSAYFGVKPMKLLNKLQKMMQEGRVVPLILGTDVIGKKWVITKIGRAIKHVYKDGTMISCEVSVSLRQYTEKGV